MWLNWGFENILDILGIPLTYWTSAEIYRLSGSIKDTERCMQLKELFEENSHKLLLTARGGKSGRFREFNSQKIFSKTRFDRKYLGKHNGIGSFANQNSSVMVNLN